MTFLYAFLVIASIYAALSAFTSILYAGKDIQDLSILENSVVDGSATFGDRVKLFIYNLLGSLIFPPVYILAGITTLTVWLLN